MTYRKALPIAIAAAIAVTGSQATLADGKSTFATALTGYQETPLTLNSPGSGEFAAKVSKDGTSIQYQLSYRGFTSDVQQAHIHFGRPAIGGMIVLFLCTNLAPPAGVPTPQACPLRSGTITGTLTPADVIARSAQGIDGGAAGFAEMVQALRAGAAYANIHTATFPTGEIRGALGHIHDNGDTDDD